jgi:hypothetical protein
MNQLLKQGTHASVVIPTVTTVTNQLTAAAIATGVWQDATAGDFATASSIGKSLYTTGNAPGAANGLQICGNNAATTYATLAVTAALTSGSIVNNGVFTQTGAVTFTGGINAGAISGTLANDIITAASINTGAITADAVAADALDGKGDWNIGKTGYALTIAPPTAAEIVTQFGTGSTLTACATATGFATPTNITAGTITTVTNLTNLPAITNNWITAAGITAGALDGKGNWNVGKTGYALTVSPPTAAEIVTQFGTGATLTACITATGFSTHSAADVKTAIEAAGGTIALSKTILDNLATMVVVDGAVYQLTANALELAPTGGLAPTVVQIRQEMDINSTQLAAIVADTGELQTNQGNWLTATGFATSGALATVDEIVDAIKLKTDTIGGAGAITWTYTVTDSSTTLPIADVDVWVTTDIGGVNVVASGKTSILGVVTFYLDAGTVYVWRQKGGYDFTNPDTEIVV